MGVRFRTAHCVSEHLKGLSWRYQSAILVFVFSKLEAGAISAQNVPLFYVPRFQGTGKQVKLSAIGATALRQGVGYA
jgi:hypothetical protein